MYILGKIIDYQQILLERTGHNRLIFSKEEEIKIGDDVYIKAICLGQEKNWFVIAYMPGFLGTEIPISFDVFNDSILAQIIHILRKHI